MLTSQNCATLQHADHIFIVLANSKAWLVSALICCPTIITLSGRLQAHTAFTMHFSYLCLLENSTLQENKIASNMFTAFSKTLTAVSLIGEHGGAQKWRGVNYYWRWCWSSIILQKLCVFFSSMALCLRSENTYWVAAWVQGIIYLISNSSSNPALLQKSIWL